MKIMKIVNQEPFWGAHIWEPSRATGGPHCPQNVSQCMVALDHCPLNVSCLAQPMRRIMPHVNIYIYICINYIVCTPYWSQSREGQRRAYAWAWMSVAHIHVCSAASPYWSELCACSCPEGHLFNCTMSGPCIKLPPEAICLSLCRLCTANTTHSACNASCQMNCTPFFLCACFASSKLHASRFRS